MLGLSTFLLLTCGLVSIQAYRRSGTNANALRRNYNGNLNTNTLDRDVYHYPYLPMQRPPIYYNDEAVDGAKVILHQGDAKIDALANTAANAALKITKKLADDMGDMISIAIADAVARILTSRIRRIPRDRTGRRNSNFNSNYNLNIMGHAGLQNPDDRQSNTDDNGSGAEGSADVTNADPSPLHFLAAQYGLNDYNTGREADINAGIMHDDEKVADGGEVLPVPTETVVVPEDLRQQGAETPVPEQPPVGSRSWGNANVNSNMNMNNYEPSGYRRNFNRNSNQNMYRRVLKANSKANRKSYRRSNVNYNSNSNQMDPHPHHHQN